MIDAGPAYDAGGGLVLATAAERLLGGATLGVLRMHQLGYDACDSIARFAEGDRWAGAEASVMPAASLSRRR